jgi:branched-chain amino acid transport system substrate-binding protein
MKRRGTFAAVAAVGLALVAGCSQKQSVKFAAVLPLTGSSPATPEIAESVKRGLELAFEHLQADPAITYELSFEIADSQGDPQRASAAATELYGSSTALVGGITTEEAITMVEASKRAEKILLSPTAIGDQLSGISRTTFYRLFPTALQQASAMANFAKERLEVAELVILIEQDRAFAQGLVEGLRTVFTQYGGKITAEISFNSSDDLGPTLDQALATPPTGIYLATSGHTAAELIQLLRDRGYGLTEGKKEWIMTTSAFAHPALIAQAGRGADGVYLTAPLFDLESQEAPMPVFRAAYKEKHGEDPDLYAGHGYDALLFYGAALKKTTSTLPTEFQKGMRSVGELTGVTGTIQFNESGDAQKFPRVHVIRGGKLVDFQKWLQEAQVELRRKQEELRREMERMRLQNTGGDTSE